MTNPEEPRKANSGANTLTDGSLLRRVRHGSQDAATQLYTRYAKRLRQLVKAESSPHLSRQVEADDIVQSVFTSFFRGVGKGYYDLPEGQELWKLFLVIALNKIRAKGNYYNAAKRDAHRTVSEAHLAALPDSGRDSDQNEYTIL